MTNEVKELAHRELAVGRKYRLSLKSDAQVRELGTGPASTEAVEP